jgi:AcrR family transcriptional regulator
MPRVIKHPDVRRSEFLDHAQALFLRRGYENTSLNDVIAESGASKGAFYHYYPSKEALLEALADRIARHALADVQDVVSEPTLDALARLNGFLAASRQFKLDMASERWTVFAALFRPENRVLYQRIAAAWEALFTPMLTKLIAEGVRERAFDTFDPEGVGDMLQQLVSTTYPIIASAIAATTDAQRKAAVTTFERRLRLHGIAIDRILGLPDGSVHIVEPGYARRFMTSLPWKPPRAIRERTTKNPRPR